MRSPERVAGGSRAQSRSAASRSATAACGRGSQGLAIWAEEVGGHTSEMCS